MCAAFFLLIRSAPLSAMNTPPPAPRSRPLHTVDTPCAPTPHVGEPLLLVDNSNTRTKFALLRHGESCPSRVRSCATADISADTLRRTLAGWAYARAVVCSVAPAAAELLRAHLGCAVESLSAAHCPHLLRGYAAPHTLGADRIANAAAVAACYPLPCVAVDLGTACTFDLVVAEPEGPRFLGGAIAPGLHTAAAALAEKTAKLPLLSPAELRTEPTPGACAQGTQQALLAGLCFGFCGMVRGVLAEMSRPLAQPPCVVLTGGDADLLADQLEGDVYVDNLLTIKGIISLSRG